MDRRDRRDEASASSDDAVMTSMRGQTKDEVVVEGAAMMPMRTTGRERQPHRRRRGTWTRTAMVIACGVACAVFGGAQAMPGDAETTATVSTKMRMRREGVEEVLDRIRQQEYLLRSIALGDEKECEDVRFKVNLPVGGRVSVRLREENGKERSISFEESGAQFACLNLDRPTEMRVVGSPKRDARGDFELHVESVDGQTLLLSDQKGPTNALSYAKITKSFADDADLSATLGKELGSCENVVFTTGFAREAGVSRRIDHKLYADTGVLVSEWKSHSNGEKKLCLIRGASYHLQISGETSYGSTRNRVAIRVSKDEAPSQDGYVYALASSNSLLRDYSTVYSASTDETRDSMYMGGRYTFHIPSDCPLGQAQLSVLLTSATYGDGVPPQGMSWMIRDSEGREVTTMASPFEAGDLGVTKHQMVCVSSGDYEFIAVASDKRGWNYGPELKLFQKWHGKPRQLLLAKGGDVKSSTPYTVEAPWFSSSMVSEPIKFEVRIGQEQSALGSTYEAPRSFANAVAALGKSKVAAGASIGLPAVICASVAAFAVFALVRGESSADANVKQSLVGDAQIAAYGTGEANDRVEDKRLKSNRQRSHRGALKILAVSSSLLAAVFAKSDPSKIKSIPILGMASPSTGRANCGMGITTCKVLHAPDCTSHSMYTYREGKLAHAPLFITPYNATALHGKPRIHMELDASSCARSDTAVCSDLGRTRADSLKECSTTCRNTEGCRAFSFEEDKCQLCSDEGSTEREGSVASITRCMDPYEFSFTDITQDQCAGACDKTKMCHAFNYFDGWADVPSHCELLQLPAALKAHVWTESSNTKNGLAGAATYYKVNSDRMCNPRGEAPVLPDLPAGLGYQVSIEVPSKGYYANFPYPSEDSYPDESKPHEYPDDSVTDGYPDESEPHEYPDDSVTDEEPQKEEQRRSESIGDQYIVSSAVVLDAFTTSSFDDNERQAFVDGLASFTDSQVEDVIIVSTRSIVGVQSKRAALEIHFVVLAPSESKAKLMFDLLADAEREQGSDQDLINQLVRAGLRSVSVAVISEKPFVTDPQQRLEPEDPKYGIDDDKYIAISGRMTLDGYTVGGMNDKAIDILTNSMGQFFTVGASNSAVVSIHRALNNVTSSSKAVTFSYMLATKKVALAEDITEALIFMRDRGSAQAKNFVHILQFRGLSAVSFVEAFGSPKLELTSEVNTNLTRVVTKTITKTVDVVSCETKLTGYSAESFTDDLQDGFREALANFLSRASSQPLSVDSIRIISVRNGSGELAVKEQAMLGLGAASSGSIVIDYEIVVDEEEEAANLEGALQQLSGGSTNDTETSSSTQANDASVDTFTSDLISSGLTEVTEVSSEPPQTSEQSFLQTIEEAIQISHDDNDGAGDNDTAPLPGFHSDYPSSNDYPTDSSDAASEAYRITSSIVFDGYTLATFDVSANMAFRSGVSTYLGIDFSDILITGLRTHLLSGGVVQLGAPSAGIEVSFTAQVESSEMAESVVGALNDISNNPAASSELRTELAEAGLEVTQVAVVETPTIVNHSSYPSGYPAPSSAYPASPDASTVPGESSTIPGGTSAYPAQTSTVPGESSTVPGESSTIPGGTSAYPAQTSTVPGESSTIPGGTSAYPAQTSTVPGESSTIPGGTSAYPAQTSTVPGESSIIVPGSTSEVPEDFSAYPGDTSTVPGESSIIVPGSTSEVPEDFSAYPGDTSTVPGESSIIVPGSTSEVPEDFSAYPGDTSTVPGESSIIVPGSTSEVPEDFSAYPGDTSTVPGESSIIVPGSTSEVPEDFSAYPGDTSTVPGESSTIVPGSTSEVPEDFSAYPGDTSTVPGESSIIVPGSTSEVPEDFSAYPGDTSTVPGESSTIVPGSTSEVPEDFSAYSGDTSTVPGESSTIVPGSTSEVPEDFSAYSGDTSTVPGERSAYPGGDEETVYVVSATCRVEGIDLGSFDAQAKNQFRSGIAAFLGVATKQVSIVAVAPITISGNRRLLQTPALDIEFMTRSTASAVANAIANEINAAVAQNNVALTQHLQQAGLNIINAAMQTQATITQSTSSQSTPATPTPSAPSGPTAVPIDINLNVNVDLNVHEDLPAPSSSSADPTPSPSSTTSAYPVPDSNTPASAYPTSKSDVPVADSSYPVLADDSACVQSGSETDLSMYDEEGSLHQSALEEAQSFALANNLTIPDADVFVRAKVCNEPHMKCCSSLGWRQDNMRRFPYVCGAAVGCQNAHFRDAKRMCTRAGGDLCRGNAVTTSADDPACPGSKTHYVWTLTRCKVNGVEGRVIRPSGGGSPGPLCEINLNTEHQVRCCSNVC